MGAVRKNLQRRCEDSKLDQNFKIREDETLMIPVGELVWCSWISNMIQQQKEKKWLNITYYISSSMEEKIENEFKYRTRVD